MEILQVKKLNENAILPTKGSLKAAGYDLCTIEEHILMPMGRKLFKTGLSISIPDGMYGRIAPRSGLAFKDGIDVLAGVIDSDYRGEIGIILINFGMKEKQIKIGDKIAQIIFEFYNTVDIQEVKELSETIRGDGGFGSTGNEIKITPGPPTHKNDTIPIRNVGIIIKEQKPVTNYESKIDIIEQWKKAGGGQGTPTTYEKLIREREKNL